MAFEKSHHIALKAIDYEAMVAFYSETLGFEILGYFPGTDTAFIDIGGTTIELGRGTATEHCPPTDGFMHLAFQVESTRDTYAELRAKGVDKWKMEPKEVRPGIWVAFFLDPDGNELELFESTELRW